MSEITIVRGTVPDVEKGGRMADGMIIGPKLSSCRWKIGNNNKLYESRGEAEDELKRRTLREELYVALGLSSAVNMSATEVVRRICGNGKAVKAILVQKKYAKSLN